MINTHDLLDALQHIDPAGLSYSEWLGVGMGLKEAGYPASAWDEWSRRDPARYHAGECERKWSGFHGREKPITAGTIIQMAQSMGWQPVRDGGHEIGWDDVIRIDGRDACRVVDKNWVEDREVSEPERWHPAEQLTRYLEALFEAHEHVGDRKSVV